MGKIDITMERTPRGEYKFFFRDNPNIFAEGDKPALALGRLLLANLKLFNVTITSDRDK